MKAETSRAGDFVEALRNHKSMLVLRVFINCRKSLLYFASVKPISAPQIFTLSCNNVCGSVFCCITGRESTWRTETQSGRVCIISGWQQTGPIERILSHQTPSLSIKLHPLHCVCGYSQGLCLSCALLAQSHAIECLLTSKRHSKISTGIQYSIYINEYL